MRLSASAHNVANLTTQDVRPLRAIQTEIVEGGATTRLARATTPAPVDLVHETLERSRATLQYTASLRLLAVEFDLRGQLVDLLA